jgi:ABC-type transport system involved in multi-copper enzyme maturation permease subunit
VTSDAVVRADPGIWPLRRRQAWQTIRMELLRNFSAWSSLRLLFLAFAPAFIIAAHAIKGRQCSLDEETVILGGIIQLYYVRFGVFFGCLGIFVRLVRGELAERTLHYLFLAPVRREVLVVSKFLAGALTTVAVFGAGILTSFTLMYVHFDAGRDFVLHGPGLAHLRAYLLVAVLACLGYGAVFLAMSLLFKNPIVPAVVVLFWEGINGVLPVWLKRLSVTYYLKPLFPVELPIQGILGLFTVVAEPTPPWLAVSGLLVFAALVLVFACWRVRRLEVLYSSD